MRTALKWTVGCLGVGILLMLGVCYFGYRQVKNFAGEGTPSVMIQAPAKRVFANIADADSLSEWRTEGLGLRAKRRGILKPGDTITVQLKGAWPNRDMRTTWIVSEVKPAKVFVVDMMGQSGRFVASRRDSLVSFGDSTLVVSTFTLLVGTSGSDSAGDSTSLAMNLMKTASRAQFRMELMRLRALLQGDSVPPRPPQP